MNERNDQSSELDRDDETLARLLRLSGGRLPISPDVETRVYDRVAAEWKASSVQRDGSRIYNNVHSAWKKPAPTWRRARWVTSIAVAATVLIAIAVVIERQPELQSIVPVGTVVRVVGERADSATSLPAVGHKILPGDRLTTGAGERISVALAASESLRIDESSELLVEGPNRFRILQGRIYADTGDFMYRDRYLVIDTPQGEVTDIGTQFSVAVDDGSLEVAVREGRVDVSRGSEAITAVAGELLQLKAGSVEPQLHRIASHDAFWNWTAELAPLFDIENKSLLDFLRWAARETGRELVFEDQELRMAAMRTDLHGSVSDFAPIEAVESVLATTSFGYRIERDRIVIQR